MKKGYKNCMGIYNKDGVCNKCGMNPRGYTTTRTIRSGVKHGKCGEYCYRNVPRKKYTWIDIEDRLPKKNKTVLVKSNRYGVQEGQYIKTTHLPSSKCLITKKQLNARTYHTFDTDCPMAEKRWDDSVIQWAELEQKKKVKKRKIIPIEPDWEKVVKWQTEEIDLLYYRAKNKRKVQSNIDISEELSKIEDLIKVRDFLQKKLLFGRL